MRTEVLNGGFVELVGSMGGDESVAEAARVTSGTLTQEGRQPIRGLIRYLVRHEHGSPMEFCQLAFHVRCPIYVMRQWRTHRIGSFNELSARYAVVQDDHQRQGPWRGQAAKNRQGSEGLVDHQPLPFARHDVDDETPLLTAEDAAFQEYRSRIVAGVAREQARTCLPLSTWTEFRWLLNLRSLLHFLQLRTDHHAQEEIRAYADAIVPMARSVAPECVQAWEDYQRNQLRLSALDLKALKLADQIGLDLTYADARDALAERVGMSKGEMQEHMEKRVRLMMGAARESDAELRELYELVKGMRHPAGHGEGSRGVFEDYDPSHPRESLIGERVRRRLSGGGL